MSSTDGPDTSVDCKSDPDKTFKTYQRTWTATDICKNLATFVQKVYVKDTTPPELETLVTPLTVNCGDEPPENKPVYKDCNHVDVTCTSGNPAPTADCADGIYSTITRTCTAEDTCGNKAAPVNQVVNVLDKEAPTITCPTGSDAGFDCDQDIFIPFEKPEAEDDCAAPALSKECCVEGGVFKRTWTATDACGKTATCEQAVAINARTCPSPE
jgi:hypothetical protein